MCGSDDSHVRVFLAEAAILRSVSALLTAIYSRDNEEFTNAANVICLRFHANSFLLLHYAASPSSIDRRFHGMWAFLIGRVLHRIFNSHPIPVIIKTSCRRAAATVYPTPLLPRGRLSAFRRRADGKVAAVSDSQHVPTPTAAAA